MLKITSFQHNHTLRCKVKKNTIQKHIVRVKCICVVDIFLGYFWDIFRIFLGYLHK